MPCVRIPLGQPIPDDPITGKPQLGSKNPLNCGCPICPTKHYCEAEDCPECGEDTEANMPCDLGAFKSCTGLRTFRDEVECVQACITIPPCCANPADCTQRIRYFDTKREAEDFCARIIELPEDIIRFEGEDEFCKVRKAVDGGVVRWASVYCVPPCEFFLKAGYYLQSYRFNGVETKICGNYERMCLNPGDPDFDKFKNSIFTPYPGKDECCAPTGPGTSGDCEEPVICPDSLLVTYDWTGTGQRDLDTATTFLGETAGYACDGGATYVTWSGDNTGDSATETATIEFKRAFNDGKWAGSTTVSLKAGWFEGAGGSGPITVRVRCAGDATGETEQSIRANPGIGRSEECNSTQVGTITISENGSFKLQ